jgi:hypothetical protein
MFKYILMLSLMLSATQLLAQEDDKSSKQKSAFKNGVFMSMSIPTALIAENDTSFRLGYRFGKVQPFVSLTYLANNSITDDDSKTENGQSTLTAHLGLKYLLKKPVKSKISPYLVGSFGTVVQNETRNGEDALKDIEQSTWIFNGAFGAQYSFTRSFSVGSELGLRYHTFSQIPKDGKESFSTSFGVTGQIFLEYVFH